MGVVYSTVQRLRLMLIDRYTPEDVFARVPELASQTDPVLRHLDRLLEMKCSPFRSALNSDGRHSTPVEVILRMLVVKHLSGWSSEQTEHWGSDPPSCATATRWISSPFPDDPTLIRWANTIQPATLHRLLDQVLDLARQRRIDSTVVETDPHFPVDSTLLNDGVCGLNRAIQRARQRVPPVGESAQASFRDRIRSIREVMRRRIATSRQREERAAEGRRSTVGSGDGQGAAPVGLAAAQRPALTIVDSFPV